MKVGGGNGKVEGVEGWGVGGGSALCRWWDLKRHEDSWCFPLEKRHRRDVSRRNVVGFAALPSKAHLFPPSGCRGNGVLLFYSNLGQADSRWIMRQFNMQLRCKCFWHLKKKKKNSGVEEDVHNIPLEKNKIDKRYTILRRFVCIFLLFSLETCSF